MASGPAAQSIIDSTAVIIPWTETNVRIPYHGIQVFAALPLVLVLRQLVAYKTTIYAMTADRFLYNRGVLLRRYDQIRLERVRDFRIIRPLGARIAGTGSVHSVSRDETMPQISIGPFKAPLEVEETIRTQVIKHQEATGYREFETT